MRKRSKVTAILVAIVMLASMVGFAAPASGGVLADSAGFEGFGSWVAIDLVAGQNQTVGQVLLNNDGTRVAVKLALSPDSIADGLKITEAHIMVGDDLIDIPYNKALNPQPGQFAVNEKFSPGVDVTPIYCFTRPSTWAGGQSLYVAAHAVIQWPELGHEETGTFCVTSNPADTDVLRADGTTTHTVIPAIDPWGALDVNVNNIAGCTDLATYLWDAKYVTGETVTAYTGNQADVGSMVDFTQPFTIPGTPTSATLKIAADNAFAYHFNGGAETSVNLASGWRDQVALGNFNCPSYTEPGVPTVVLDADPSGWSRVHTYNVLSSLTSGANALNVTGVNADWNTTSPLVNPACVIYKLCGTYSQWVVDRPTYTETAWGSGTRFTTTSWATYSRYTIQSAPAVPVLRQTLTVAPNGVPQTSMVLEAGKHYVLEASGTYRFATWGDAGIADAEYSLRLPGYSNPASTSAWISGDVFPGAVVNYLQIMVSPAGETPVAQHVHWGDFAASHVYTVPYDGSGAALSFRILDDYYGDNSGSLTVKIYELP